MRTSRTVSGLLFLVAVLSGVIPAIPTPVAAQVAGPLRRARATLADYDLEGDRTTAAIGGLTDYVRDRGFRSRDVREAWVLRCTTAADLLVLAARDGNPGLRQQLARALSVPEPTLDDTILDNLDLVAAWAPVGALDGPETGVLIASALARGEAVDWFARRGPQRDALFVAHVRRALEGAADPVAALSDLAPDPCTAGGACVGPRAGFDAEGRRAIRALAEAGHAAERIREAAEGGLPFAVAAAPAVRADRDALTGVLLSPRSRLDATLGLARVAASGRDASPGLVLAVGTRGVRFGFSPQVALTADGEVSLVAPGLPILPATEVIPFEGTPRAIARPLEEIVQALRRIAGPLEGVTVAVGVSPDTPMHVLARVLLSAERAGLPTPALVASDAAGMPRVIPLRLVRSQPAGDGDEVRVRVRLGGYSLHTPGGGFQDLPRVRETDRGPLRFDAEALRAGVGDDRPRSASLSFMSAVGSAPVVRAAFAVAPAEAPLTLLVP